MSQQWGKPFPTRSLFGGDPVSSAVESDEEFQNRHATALASVPTQVADTDAASRWTPWWQSQVAATNVGLAPDTKSGGAYDASLAAEKAANSFGLTIIGPQWGGGTPDIGIAADGPINDPGSFMKDNTDARNAATSAYNKAISARKENNVRQQQAYDTTMMGNGGWGGTLPANYTDPNYGQVTGRIGAPQSTGGLAGLGGYADEPLADASATGAYNGGSGAYNPMAWSESGFGKRWGGF